MLRSPVCTEPSRLLGARSRARYLRSCPSRSCGVGPSRLAVTQLHPAEPRSRSSLAFTCRCSAWTQRTSRRGSQYAHASDERLSVRNHWLVPLVFAGQTILFACDRAETADDNDTIQTSNAGRRTPRSGGSGGARANAASGGRSRSGQKDDSQGGKSGGASSESGGASTSHDEPRPAGMGSSHASVGGSNSRDAGPATSSDDEADAQVAVEGISEDREFANWPMPDAVEGAAVQPSYSTTDLTVSDNVTKLVWQRVLPQTYAGCTGKVVQNGDACTFDEAERYCTSEQVRNELGGSGWRLPTRTQHERGGSSMNATWPSKTSSSSVRNFPVNESSGNNQSGQLGDGTANVLDEPTRVSSVSSSRPGE
jgi:hypothetical protein